MSPEIMEVFRRLCDGGLVSPELMEGTVLMVGAERSGMRGSEGHPVKRVRGVGSSPELMGFLPGTREGVIFRQGGRREEDPDVVVLLVFMTGGCW
ncbi:hypothetical protein HAX54_021572 [Datura stramonium]|uniref:Uncharacterized protein n=1 Tax=Datura stramonium TaxID=4076 RepID=A0ABS8UT55_DATST|nr:hypothetical protein [Datura stramonium]